MTQDNLVGKLGEHWRGAAQSKEGMTEKSFCIPFLKPKKNAHQKKRSPKISEHKCLMRLVWRDVRIRGLVSQTDDSHLLC